MESLTLQEDQVEEMEWETTDVQEDANEGLPRALAEVIASLNVIKITREKVGESWLCLLR